mmetsp:Transcript_71728/g.233202  ORF Transcript_71728/g.233202 Transcript_71728/m.233202 type:complete len:209 (+) Transcript_71728:944-1570(+)
MPREGHRLGLGPLLRSQPHEVERGVDDLLRARGSQPRGWERRLHERLRHLVSRCHRLRGALREAALLRKHPGAAAADAPGAVLDGRSRLGADLERGGGLHQGRAEERHPGPCLLGHIVEDALADGRQACRRRHAGRRLRPPARGALPPDLRFFLALCRLRREAGRPQHPRGPRRDLLHARQELRRRSRPGRVARRLPLFVWRRQQLGA